MIKRHTYILATIILAAAGCTKAETDIPDTQAGTVRFFAESVPFGAAHHQTRTAILTDFSSFQAGVSASTETSHYGLYEDVTFTRRGSYYESDLKWPEDGAAAWRFDCANGPVTWDAEHGFTVTADTSSDMIVATLDPAHPASAETLTFRHLFAMLGTVYVSPADGYTISGVTVTLTPLTGGTYAFREGSPDGRGWYDTTAGSPVGIAPGSAGMKENGFLLVPGTYALTAGWTATRDGSSKTYSNVTSTVPLEGGKTNTVSIILGGNITSTAAPYGFSISSPGDTFPYHGATKRITLEGYGREYGISFSGDGGLTWYGTAPAGVNIQQLSWDNDIQTYAVSAYGTSAGTSATPGVWPSDARHNTPLGSALSPVDLSLLDIHGDALPKGRETANTYTVHAPGTYMIPLVYGNAVTGGQNNPSCYRTSSTSSRILPTMVNAYGTGISSPYIAKDAAANGHAASSASLLWCEADGMVSVSPTLEEHGGLEYLVFTVNTQAIGYGNAVVSLLDEQGTTIWSWLIWVTANDLYDETVEARTSPATREVTFLSEAIGYVPPAGTGYIHEREEYLIRFSTSINQFLYYKVTIPETMEYTSVSGSPTAPFYQFGRNIPAPRSNVAGYAGASDGAQVSMATAIRNPGTFYIRSEFPYNWCSDNDSQFYNVWNMNQTAGDQDVPVIKSVYDPSPAGYVLPRRNDFTYFTTDGSNHDSSGYAYYNVIDRNNDGSITSADLTRGWFMKRHEIDTQGLYFPAAGFRYSESGSIYSVGSYGYYWSSSPNGAGSARSLGFSSGNLNPLISCSWAYGFSVRPVRKDE